MQRWYGMLSKCSPYWCPICSSLHANKDNVSVVYFIDKFPHTYCLDITKLHLRCQFYIGTLLEEFHLVSQTSASTQPLQASSSLSSKLSFQSSGGTIGPSEGITAVALHLCPSTISVSLYFLKFLHLGSKNFFFEYQYQLPIPVAQSLGGIGGKR